MKGILLVTSQWLQNVVKRNQTYTKLKNVKNKMFNFFFKHLCETLRFLVIFAYVDEMVP